MSNATWKRHPHSAFYNNDDNWSGGHTPTSVATFGASSITHLIVASNVAIDGWHFKKGAPHYFFSITPNNDIFFNGDGIVNKHSGVTITNAARLYFYNFAKAGSAHITNKDSLYFENFAKAGSAHITNNDSMYFYDFTTAGSAQITNKDSLYFENFAKAGSAHITDHGYFAFEDHSSADRAVITTTSKVFFQDNSDGGTARLIAKTGGQFDFSQSAGPDTNHLGVLHAGSIEGAGTYYLGGRWLVVGGNNRSTTVSGEISDGGESLGSGATLEKIGHGTLKLAHANNSFTGGIALTAGTLDIAAFEAAGPGGIAFGSGRQTLKIENGAFSSFDFGTEIHLFGAGDKLILSGLKFHKHATAIYDSFHTLTVKSGNVTKTFSQFYDPQQGNFKVVNDGHGGTKVVLVAPHAKPHAADSFHFSDATVEAGSRSAAEPHFAPAATTQHDNQPAHANLGDAADASFVAASHPHAGLADFAHGGDVFV